MREAFEQAGVWKHKQMRKRIAVAEYTHPGDPLKIDCGYRPNGEVKLFHAVSLASTDGVPVVKTRRSFGNSKYVPADKIRCQLKVNEQQFAGLISCDVTKEDYIKILIAKRVIIPKQEQPPADQTPKAPS